MYHFSQGQLARIAALLAVAEDRTGDHFHLPAFDGRYAPYDLYTQRDLPPHRRQPRALAEVLRLERTDPPQRLPSARRHRPPYFYRIALYDHNILRRLAQDPALAFDPLLLYVLTHELVHIARFATRKRGYHAPAAVREDEEREVDRITGVVLRGLPGIDQVVHRVSSV